MPNTKKSHQSINCFTIYENNKMTKHRLYIDHVCFNERGLDWVMLMERASLLQSNNLFSQRISNMFSLPDAVNSNHL
jgi:hypothetical protein